METVQQLINKANTLPIYLQEELLDFADFLIAKHGIAQQEDELDEQTKALLDRRLKAFEKNRGKAVKARDFLTKVKEQYK